ncbi:MAG: ornithine cyclodeaminase family protein [Nitrososphaerota archaeon]|nr:ornithine cyclodeaminase family protein [Aigarchaeota archaeon]MDW8076770.1 ornithine cyclodeaminase family protein [Nitrososphaerota archaeon]
MHNGVEVLLLSEEDVISIGLTMSQCMNLVEEVLKARTYGQVLSPPKVFLDMRLISEHQCDADAMPAYVKYIDMCGVKWIGANWDNRYKRGLPNVIGIIILNDPESFAPLAIISANWLTAMRTGAATGLAVRELAKKGSKSLSIIGTGYEAKFQLMAINEVIRLDEVKVFDIDGDAMESFLKNTNDMFHVKTIPCRSVKEAVEGTDIVVTVTSSRVPVLNGDFPLDTVNLICSLGTYNELSEKLVNWFDKIVVDTREQTKSEGALVDWFAKGLITNGDIHAELGEILTRRKEGRVSDDEKILCVLTGLGCEDIVVANIIYKTAKEKGLGRKFKLF